MTDAEDLLLEIANSMEKDFLDPGEHANWCVKVAKEYFTKKGARDENAMADTDIKERLRACYERRALPTWADIREAADELEQLTAEIEEWRECAPI